MIVVALVHVWFVIAGVYLAPVGFDEAYVIQAPWNLAQGNGYATFDWQNGGPLHIFDELVSTGPVVLLPLAGTFALFGVGIVQARWTMALFYIFFLVVAWLFGKRIGGRWAGVVAIVATLAINLRYDYPHTAVWSVVDGLGELPSAAFILLAALLLTRSRVAAGTALGLAALCKLAAFLVLPVFVIVLILFPVVAISRGAVRSRLVPALVVAAFTVLPSALWEGVKLLTFGFSSYIDSLRAYVSFVRRSGSGVDGAGGANDLIGRARYLDGLWFLNNWLALAVLAVLLGLGVIALLARIRASRASTDAPVRPWLVPVLAAGGSAAIFIVWWVGISSSFFARHAFTGLILLPPVLAALGVAGLQVLRAQRQRLARVALIVIAAAWVLIAGFQTTVNAVQAAQSPAYTRADQEDAAAFISQFDNVQHVDFFSNPELLLLSGVRSYPYPHGDHPNTDGPLVLSPQMKGINEPLFALALAMCGDVLYDKAGFIVCDIRDDYPN